MNLKVYTQRKYDSRDTIEASVGKSIIIDSATTFYTQLEDACSDGLITSERYALIRDVFRRVVDQAILDCKIALVGMFSKLDYCIKEYEIPDTIASLIHNSRKEMFRDGIDDETLAASLPHNVKATACLVYHLSGKEEIPESLKAYFPKADRQNSWGKFNEKVLRVSVLRWNEQYIWATEEENGSELQISYGEENKFLNRNGESAWGYLNQILWEGAVLNLVHIRMSEVGDICLPELIILEPDYLINITTIAGCFETYAESPFVNLINKVKPSPNTRAIHLGNLSGQLLDNTVHGKEIAFQDSLKEFISKNALSVIACQELISCYSMFVNDGEIQKRNIDKLINEDLPASVGDYDRKSVILEPSFFSAALGLQGRFDFLEETDDRVIIIEQKSGKSEYNNSQDEEERKKLKPKEQHTVQALLYRAIYQYELDRIKALQITPMLLYSKYDNGLLALPPMPKLFLRAIKIRNLLAWSEFFYAKEGMNVIATLTPDNLNQKKTTGNLWDRYTRPDLEKILNPIHNATSLERAYYLRFLRFIANEQLLSKVGNKMKESSGFASIWHDTLEEKKAAGNIYDQLTIADYGFDAETVTNVKLRFREPQTADTTNFRIGDIVMLYPYREGEVPNACAQMVNRATIVDIQEDLIELQLRNPQTDKKIFADKPADTRWAIEHDLFDSMTGSLYKGMHAFLSAPKERRDLILSQREPEVDETLKICGEYGRFNGLVTRAKQARDLFLIIGPPGTGKTSFGLVNLLKEELLEADSNILLLSYTNRAVDEICSKLLEIKAEDPEFDFIRIGSDLSCSDEYKPYTLRSRCAAAKSGNEVNQMIGRCRVFCGTTASLNANLALFELKHFTLAIVDEASQILEPHLIGLLSAISSKERRIAIDRFVLIGDHKQLPAVVQQPPEESAVTEPELNEIHLKDCRLSLFERLLMQFKTDGGYDDRFVYMLRKQGRMHRDIAEFPNYAFYGNKLDIVPLAHQELPNEKSDSANGIIRLLTSRRIVFLAADAPKHSLSPKTNSVEAEMIAATVRQIYEMTGEGFDADKTVGIIVPYRNQISTVRNAIDRFGIPTLHDITIDTVERYQGSQRDYIIYGFTIQQPYQLNFLTNNVFEEDGALIDRKLNVAMTRARLNLVMIGNPLLLNENFTFYKLMEFVRSKGGYFKIPLERYCKGEFDVPDQADINDVTFSDAVFSLPTPFRDAFERLVIDPIRQDPRTDYPAVILGNTMDANKSLINYGRINFSNQLSLFSSTLVDTVGVTPADQVLIYCYYIMRSHYCSALSLFHAHATWLTDEIRKMDGRVQMVDIGCGPATCGLAFHQQFGDSARLTYTGVDVSEAMKQMGGELLRAVGGYDIRTRFVTSLHELDDSHWSSVSEVPNLVVFSLSYFFSNINSDLSERIADRIIDIMKQQPLNRYVFFIQHSEHDNRLRAYTVFRKRLSRYVNGQRAVHSQFSYQLKGNPLTLPFCYEVWTSR